jgi:ABC-2 type transport system permease protein
MLFSWSEDGGFLSNLANPGDIDQVYLTSAHEMMHQWWGYIINPAKSEGAFLLTETIAQYGSAVCLEREYGREIIEKYLKKEMDDYLRLRKQDREGERPMMRTFPSQNYLNYPKSTIVMHALSQYLGQDKVNLALKRIIDRFGYRSDRFATSADLVNELRKVTPDELQYLITDLFETITLYDNRTVSATANNISASTFEVTFTVSCTKLRADAIGNETSIPVNDLIPVGVYGDAGKELYYAFVPFTESRKSISITVEGKPIKAGIDPRCILIDRNRGDNCADVEMMQTN